MGVEGSNRCPDHRADLVKEAPVEIPVKVYNPRTDEILPAVKVVQRGVGKGQCRKCGQPRAKGSDSYCRKHEAERVKEWRKSKKQT